MKASSDMDKSKRVKYKSFKNHLKQELSKDKELNALYQFEKIKLKMAHVLAEIREHMNMTQKDLAKRIGVSQQLISRIESGTVNLTLETLVKILTSLKTVFMITPTTIKKRQDVLEFVEK